MYIFETNFVFNKADIGKCIKDFPYKIREINESQLKITYAPHKLQYILAYIAITIITTICSLLLICDTIPRIPFLCEYYTEKSLIQFVLLSLVLYTISLFMLIYSVNLSFLRQRQMIILDRINGTISLPASEDDFWKKWKTFIFSECFAGGGAFVAYSKSKKDCFYNEVIIRYDDCHKLHFRLSGRLKNSKLGYAWGFLVWFMDKNRPLPFSTAFDAYRKADYIRRWREGFPKPLYATNVATPEFEGEIISADFENEDEYQKYLQTINPKYKRQYLRVDHYLSEW